MRRTPFPLFAALFACALSARAAATPLWCGEGAAVFGGGTGGVARIAVPALSVTPEGSPVGRWENGVFSVCAHTTAPVEYHWTLLPDNCLDWLVPDAYGDAHLSVVDPFLLGLFPAMNGGPSHGGLSFWNFDPTGAHSRLWGPLSAPVASHPCAAGPDALCLSCGRSHGASEPCFHSDECATKTNIVADCTCPPPFVRIGDELALRLAGEEGCCCASLIVSPDLVSSSPALGASVSNDWIVLAPTDRSPTIGGHSARYRVFDATGGVHRALTLRATAADLGIEPVPSDAPVPYDWQEGPEAYYVTSGTLHVARRAAPYPIRLWNESPSDARLVFSFSSPTNGPGLFDPSLVTRHPSLVSTNAAPFSSLNSDATVHLDANCSNALATLSLTLSDPAANRTFLTESLSVQVFETDPGEHWRVRSATDRLSWDFSDAPEDVYAYLWIPGNENPFGELVGFSKSRTPSISLDLPPGDYLLDFYFPRVYDGGSWAAWSTNYLHVLDTPSIVSLNGCNAQNRAVHHTALYETNAVVVRRAQSFRFETTVTKWFDPSRHELRFFLADDFDGHWTTNEVLAGTGTQPTTEWFYRIISTSMESNGDVTLVSDIYCSTTNCPVGAYRIGARLYDRQTGECLDENELDQDLIVLFNPWSDKDSVYMADDTWRNECVLQTNGIIWRGSATNMTAHSWHYDQFSQNAIAIMSELLGALSRPNRSKPTSVARNLSWFCNANSGVLIVGKWGAPYAGGKTPTQWKGSGEIFDEYASTRSPVRYGQCWVFAGVLTSLGRTAGIPSRPVTNYDSGHDANGNKSIDYYFDQTGCPVRSISDSIWNYHVWTEMWMSRPDVDETFDWQIVDATPQELSGGKYQCGPASRRAVKTDQGGIYDVDFVFSEVSAPVRLLHENTSGSYEVTRTLTGQTGKHISTKQMGSSFRLDLTSEYK